MPHGDVVIAWTPVRGAVGCTLEIEQGELGFTLRTDLPAWQPEFAVPVQVLQPDRTYEYSLPVRGATDNELEIEGEFTTADKKRETQARRAQFGSETLELRPF